MLDEQLPLAIAHRGSRVLWPENTEIAFAGAVALGYRWLETDLHLTRDGHLVCLHDDSVDRTTDGTGLIWDLDLATVRSLDASARFAGPTSFRETPTIPTLATVVEAFPDARLVVDLKQDGLEEPLADLVERAGLWDRLVVGSFSDERIRRFRAATSGRVATSTGSRESFRVWARAWWGTPPVLADALQIPRYYRGLPAVTPRTVSGFHRGGYQVHVWTVNEPDEMRELLDWGVDGIITDRPDLLKDVLIERDSWAGG